MHAKITCLYIVFRRNRKDEEILDKRYDDAKKLKSKQYEQMREKKYRQKEASHLYDEWMQDKVRLPMMQHQP